MPNFLELRGAAKTLQMEYVRRCVYADNHNNASAMNLVLINPL